MLAGLSLLAGLMALTRLVLLTHLVLLTRLILLPCLLLLALLGVLTLLMALVLTLLCHLGLPKSGCERHPARSHAASNVPSRLADGSRPFGCSGGAPPKLSEGRPGTTIALRLGMSASSALQGDIMRSILLWLLGVPIPIIILIALLWH